jgi:hypothetical protein
VDYTAVPHQAVVDDQFVERRRVLDVVGTPKAASQLPG